MPLLPFGAEHDLRAWVANHRSRAAPVRGDFYRVVGPRHASPRDIVSGAGAATMQGGGRWNPPGLFPAVYASDVAETAVAEALAHSRRNGIPDHQNMPKVIVGVRIKCDAVLNLADPTLGSTLPIDLATLLAEEWWLANERGRETGGQALGRLAREAGLHGLVVPSSARPGHTNILVLVDRLPRWCGVEVLHPEGLRRLRR